MLSTDASTPRTVGFCRNSSSFGGRVLVVACDSMRRTDTNLTSTSVESVRCCTGSGQREDRKDHSAESSHWEMSAVRSEKKDGGTDMEEDHLVRSSLTAAVTSSDVVREPSPVTAVSVQPMAHVGVVRPVSRSSLNVTSLSGTDEHSQYSSAASPQRQKAPDQTADKDDNNSSSSSSAANCGRSSAPMKLEDLFSSSQVLDAANNETSATTKTTSLTEPVVVEAEEEDGSSPTSDEVQVVEAGNSEQWWSKLASKTLKPTASRKAVTGACCFRWPVISSGDDHTPPS